MDAGRGALEAGLGPVSYVGIGVLMLSALLTACYLLPIITSAFFPGKGFDRSQIVKQQDTWLMWITLCFLTASVVILGMYPGLLSPAVEDILAPLFG